MSKLDSKKYNKELKNLQVELIKLQECPTLELCLRA